MSPRSPIEKMPQRAIIAADKAILAVEKMVTNTAFQLPAPQPSCHVLISLPSKKTLGFFVNREAADEFIEIVVKALKDEGDAAVREHEERDVYNLPENDRQPLRDEEYPDGF